MFSTMVATNHIWLLNTWNVAGTAEGLSLNSFKLNYPYVTSGYHIGQLLLYSQLVLSLMQC